MKAYKVRSLIYLSAFIVSAVIYYNIEQKEMFQNSLISTQVTQVEFENEEAEKADKESDEVTAQENR